MADEPKKLDKKAIKAAKVAAHDKAVAAEQKERAKSAAIRADRSTDSRKKRQAEAAKQPLDPKSRGARLERAEA